MSIYRSHAGRRELEAAYRGAVEQLSVGVEEQWIETSHGSTHVLVSGPADGQPVVIFHGGNATNPMTLAWYTGLTDEFRLIAPDTIGQPGESAETRVDPRGDGYGEWVEDILDAFSLRSASVIGTSYGGGIVLRAGAHIPDRIDRAVLVVPAGFGTGSLISMLRIGLPSVLYRFRPSDRLLEQVLRELVTDADPDPVIKDTIAASLRHVKLEREFPGATAEELSNFDAPVVLFVAENDPFFPPKVVKPRARERIPVLSKTVVLRGEKHVLSPEAQQRVTATIRNFLNE